MNIKQAYCNIIDYDNGATDIEILSTDVIPVEWLKRYKDATFSPIVEAVLEEVLDVWSKRSEGKRVKNE